MLPYFEEEGLKNLYNYNNPWYSQLCPTSPTLGIPNPAGIDVPGAVVSIFVCPSNGGDNPLVDEQLAPALSAIATGCPYTASQLYGGTTYAFCKGVTDAWHFPGYGGRSSAPYFSERGMFDFNFQVSIRKITDGTSRTIAMGEGAYGPKWQCAAVTTPTAARTTTLRMAVATGSGATRQPFMTWINAEPAFSSVSGPMGIYLYSVFACTIEPLNKNPVTSAWVSSADVMSTAGGAKSMAGANGTLLPTSCSGPYNSTPGGCGPHIAPNFRSDHPGGGNFLYADGSVHFINEDIDMLTYQRMSTMAGDDVVEVPE